MADREGESMNMFATVVPLLFFAIWLAPVIYVLVLMTRLTRAAERVAAAMERNPRGPL